MDVVNARREPDDVASIDRHDDMMSLVAQELRHQSWIEGVVEHSSATLSRMARSPESRILISRAATSLISCPANF